MACQDDFDCQAGFMCFANVSWAPSSNEEGLCLCNGFFGFSGNSCQEFGVTTYFILISSAIQGGVALLFFVHACVEMCRSLYYFWKRRRLLVNATMFTFLLCSIAFLCYALWQAFYFLEAYFPQSHALSGKLAGPEENRTSTWAKWTRSFIVCTLIFVLYAAMNVSLIWLQVSNSARTITESGLKRYRRLVYTTEALFTAAMILGGALGMLELLAVFAAPFLVGLIVSFSVGRYRMIALLREALEYVNEDPVAISHPSDPESPKATTSSTGVGDKTQRTRTQRAIRSIQLCNLNVILSLVLILASGAVFFIMSNFLAPTWKEFAQPGKLSLITVIVDLLPLGILYLAVTIHLYTSRSVRKLIRQGKAQTSSLGVLRTGGPLTSIIPDTEML